jgi:hypothetical protein
MEMKIAPRRYTRKLSEIIKKILHEQIAIIEESQILQIRTALKEKINQTYKNSYKDPEEWIEKSIEFLHNEISQEIIKPLVARIEGPLKKQAYNIIDTLIEAEKELATLIAAELSEKMPNILAKYLAIQNDRELTTVLNTFLLGNYTNITSANSNVTNTFAYNTLNTAGYTDGSLLSNTLAICHVVCDATNNMLYHYINGALVNSGVSRTGWSTGYNTIFYLGYDAGGTNEYMGGNFYQFAHYNKVLSSSEILNNYNALKGRFGL